MMVEAEKAADFGSRTILFVDEIHRFNKAQQDAFLPYVERGSIRLIGATTENPSFEINAALLSRCRVYTLRRWSGGEIIALLRARARRCGAGAGCARALRQRLRRWRRIASYASGDARNALNALEVAAEPALGAASTRITQATCRRGAAAARAAVRQEGRAALRHHLGAAQERAQLRCRRCALLAGTHAGRPAKTRCTWRGAWCAWRSKTSAWPRRRR